LTLKDRAIFGIIWNGLGKFLNQAMQLLIMVILARLLTPSDFGVIGIAFIFTRFITLVNEMGIAASIIQKLDIQEKDLNTMFTVGLVVGFALMLILIVAAKSLAIFFETEILEPVLKMLAVIFFIGSLGLIQKALFNRDVDFKTIAIVETIGTVFYGVISITFALFGYGVWSIVYGAIANHVVTTAIFYFKSHWKPKIRFHYDRFVDNIKFGANVFGTNLVNYFYQNLVSFVTGKYLGTAPLGLYTLANNLTSQTVGRLSYIVGRVMFPTMSKIQDDNERLANAYLKVLYVLSLIAFPFLVGSAVLAKPLVLFFFGEKWSGSIFPVQVLAVVAIIQSINRTINYILLAKGRSDIEFKWDVFYIFVLSGMLLVTIKHGLNTLVVGIFVISIVGAPVIQKITFSLIDLTLWKVYKTLSGIFISSLLMGIVVYFISFFSSKYFSNFFVLLISGVVGTVIFLGFIRIFDKKNLWEIKKSFSETNLAKKFGGIKESVLKPGFLKGGASRD